MFCHCPAMKVMNPVKVTTIQRQSFCTFQGHVRIRKHTELSDAKT